MRSSLASEVLAALSEFSSRTRLYELKLPDRSSLLVEAFAADDALDGIGFRDVIALSSGGKLDAHSLLGRQASLEISLADGTRAAFGGHISQVATLGSDGGLSRHRLRLAPWIWLLSQVTNSRAWADSTFVQIVDAVFAKYQPHASWRWSVEVGRFIADAMPRSYCAQYRETDFDFVSRLLAEEGISWRFEEHEGSERMVLFSDSSRECAVPKDASGPVRYHAASALEKSDSIQYLQVERTLGPALVTALSYNYKTKRSVAVNVPTKYPIGGRNAQAVESFDCPGEFAYADGRQARRYAEMAMEAHEARGLMWQGRSTVRTLRAGTRLGISGVPIKQYRDGVEVVVLRVASVGVNNLPVTARTGLQKLFGGVPELLAESLKGVDLAEFDKAVAQAQRSGYANCFEAIAAERPWRPATHLGPTALGSQSAIVVGADGSHEPNGADEIYCDRLGRVRVRFHWQQENVSCWVRVAQRSAGPRTGSQFLPRIGQEVLVKFMEGDIDRPVIVGALYNGQGEGGVLPTPGGKVDRTSDIGVFARAHDHFRGGQGNLAGGNSPVWHGASADSAGHRNPSAQWGIRSKELGGRGYNQLLFDDTDGQGRVQLKSTQAASELNLGHLIHGVDNYRGSFRGAGAELRTDAYGSVRAGAGLLVSSYKISHSRDARAPAGENAAANSLLQHATKLAASFSAAAKSHLTVELAGHLGAAKQNASALDDAAAPLKAMAAALAATHELSNVDVPHPNASLIGIAAKAGLAMVAGQDVQLANGETVTIMSGADAQYVSGGQMRVQCGQALGVLAGAVAAGDGNIGLQMISAKDSVDYQAQSDQLTVQARDEINVISANAHIDWAAAKSISLSTAGGANITIAGGNITVQCPGKITVHAGMKKFNAPDKLAYPMPALPRSICVECLKKSVAAGSAFTLVE